MVNIKRGIRFLIGHGNNIDPWTVRLRFAVVAALNVFKPKKSYRPAVIDDAALLKQLEGFTSLHDYYNHLKQRPKPAFFYFSELHDISADYEKLFPGKKREIIAAANNVLEHIFDLLGSGTHKLCAGNGGAYKPIPWHTDFKSGFTWDKTTDYKDIKYGDKHGVDVKVPWELSRCQHFTILGKAYRLTGDEKYAREFVNEVEDWIENNPVGLGVNWVCAMDVAIRAVNWWLGFYLVKDSPALTGAFLDKFVKSLFAHGFFIAGNLEKDLLGHNSNHYLSDLAGLAYVGVLLPELKTTRKWRDYAFKQLIKETEKQVYPDGTDYEGSTSYHRLVTEILLSVTLLYQSNGFTLPASHLKKLENMLGFVRAYTRPDGLVPQIGDNDNGRLHILSQNENLTDHRYLLAIGAALFSRSDFKQSSGGFSEDGYWLLGEKGRRQFESLAGSGEPPVSQAFHGGGYYIQRRDDLYLIMDCLTPNNSAPAGHRHNSRLSIELYAGDKAFIVDPGTYLYTPDPEMRNIFRGTAYHNTVMVDDIEQNQTPPEALFLIGQDARIKVNRWRSAADYDILDVEHTGYKRLGNPVLHRRQVFFDKKDGFWIIRDLLAGVAEHRCCLYFHFAPMEIAAVPGFPPAVTTKASGVNMALIPLVTEGLTLEIGRGWISGGYGLKTEAPVIKYQRHGLMPVVFCNILYPFKNELDIKHILEKAGKIDLNRYFGGEA
jgi:hypothetical protein